MVTIEEENEHQGSCKNDNSTGDDDPYAWKNLMGEDIRFRLLSSEGNKDLSQTPEARDFVRISFRGYVKSDDETNKLFIEKDDFIMVLGESDVPPGLEMGIRFCPIGCSGEVICTSKFAYGDRGRKKQKDDDKYVAVLPSAQLFYSFFVHEVIDYVDDLQQVQIKKSIGNESFQYDLDDGYKALLIWKKALNMIESFINQPNIPDDRIQSFEKLKVDLHNNIALVQFNQKQYNECKASCNTILNELDENNSKACVRLGYALLELDAEFDEINKVIQKASKLSPGGMQNSNVRKLYSIYKKKKSEYIEKRKEVSMKMMKSYNLSKNDDQQGQEDEGSLNQKEGYNFRRYFGTMELLLLTTIALTVNELYHNPVLLDDMKQRFYILVNKFQFWK